MFEFIKGNVIEKTATSVVVETPAGLGYRIQIPLSTSESLPSLQKEIRLLLHFVVREDAHVLYGFSTEEERSLFRNLIGVNGIGPKLVLTVLSGVPAPALRQAIVQGNLEILRGISGIGKKTAERIVIELREKIMIEGGTAEVAVAVPSGAQALVEDSLEALVALGYRKPNAKAAIERVLQQEPSEKWTVEALIRASLKYVA